MFSSLQILPADEKIMRLYSDIKQIIDIFLPQTDEIYPTERNIPNDDGLILITAVVTSCIRGLKYCKSKLHCLEILQQLSMYTTAETVLDRILPYIVCTFHNFSFPIQLEELINFNTNKNVYHYSYIYVMIQLLEFGSVLWIR